MTIDSDISAFIEQAQRDARVGSVIKHCGRLGLQYGGGSFVLDYPDAPEQFRDDSDIGPQFIATRDVNTSDPDGGKFTRLELARPPGSEPTTIAILPDGRPRKTNLFVPDGHNMRPANLDESTVIDEIFSRMASSKKKKRFLAK